MSVIINYFRKKGITIGHNCMIYSNISTPEPYLIEISDNVTIAGGVKFVTHDNSISKVLPQYTIAVGQILIGKNTFIGANSLILPGVSIGNNCIIAAGSVVTKSFGESCIIGGNPAKVIGSVEELKNKYISKGLYSDGISFDEKKELILQNKMKWIRK